MFQHKGPALVCAIAVLTLVTVSAVAAPAEAKGTEQHCRAHVTSQLESGQMTLSSVECGDQPDQARAAADTVIATHYTGANFTGSTFTVYGTGCTGGWLNLPSAWIDVISSTASACTVDHFDLFYRGGSLQRIWGPGGNLTTLDNSANSAQYL